MYVHSITIQNVRGFGPAQVELDLSRGGRPAGWTVIAGRNGAGKSTFLRAIALSVLGPFNARAMQETFAGWVRSGVDTAKVIADIGVAPEDQFFGPGNRPVRFKVGLEWKRSATGPEPVLSAVDDINPVRGRKAPERGPWFSNPAGWFLCGYGPFRRLTGHASDAQRLMVGPKPIARVVSLFREDASLVESVQWMKEILLRSLEARPDAAAAKALLDDVLRLLGDGLLPEGMEIEKFDSEGLWVRQGAVSLPLRDVSDGYRTTAALVLDLARQVVECSGSLSLRQGAHGWEVGCPGVVLIDEIDVHLHVSWQQRIGFWLKRHFPNVQFLVTTHSPFVCQAADEEGIIRLPAPGEGAPACHVSKEVFAQVVNGGADEAVLTELFGLERSHSYEAESLREAVAALEAKVIRGQASEEELKEHQRLVMQLPHTLSSDVERVLRAVEDE